VLHPSDLLIQRIGRRSIDSIGPLLGMAAVRWTDCVLCIRPKKPNQGLELLFTLRCLLASPQAKALLQRASGPEYIVQRELEALVVPTRLAAMQGNHFAAYRLAVRQKQRAQMRRIEKRVASILAAASRKPSMRASTRSASPA